VSWLLLWAWSISQSSGGIAYTLRVLSPVLALAAVAGGVALSRLLWPPWRRAAACMLLLLSVEASLRALLVLASPLDVPPRRWLSAATWLSALSHDEAFDRMAKLVGSGRVLSDNAYHFAFLADRGVAVLPPWSPEVNFLTAEPMDVPEVTQRLRAAGVRFILRSATPDLVSYLRRYPFFQARQPWLEPVMKGEGWILFALRERKD